MNDYYEVFITDIYSASMDVSELKSWECVVSDESTGAYSGHPPVRSLATRLFLSASAQISSVPRSACGKICARARQKRANQAFQVSAATFYPDTSFTEQLGIRGKAYRSAVVRAARGVL